MALYHTCQALAAIRGREFVIPDDVKAMAPPVLTHRLVVNPQTRLRGRRPTAFRDTGKSRDGSRGRVAQGIFGDRTGNDLGLVDRPPQDHGPKEQREAREYGPN